MSHVVQVKDVCMTNQAAIALAVERTAGASLIDGMKVKRHKIYQGHAEGIGVKLPAWQYPVVIDAENGTIRYDNYGGSWGKQAALDELVQGYSIETMRATANAAGLTLREIEDEVTHDVKLVCEQF